MLLSIFKLPFWSHHYFVFAFWSLGSLVSSERARQSLIHLRASCKTPQQTR